MLIWVSVNPTQLWYWSIIHSIILLVLYAGLWQWRIIYFLVNVLLCWNITTLDKIYQLWSNQINHWTSSFLFVVVFVLFLYAVWILLLNFANEWILYCVCLCSKDQTWFCVFVWFCPVFYYTHYFIIVVLFIEWISLSSWSLIFEFSFTRKLNLHTTPNV